MRLQILLKTVITTKQWYEVDAKSSETIPQIVENLAYHLSNGPAPLEVGSVVRSEVQTWESITPAEED